MEDLCRRKLAFLSLGQSLHLTADRHGEHTPTYLLYFLLCYEHVAIYVRRDGIYAPNGIT